jgi:hypothetical protein
MSSPGFGLSVWVALTVASSVLFIGACLDWLRHGRRPLLGERI